MVYYLLFERVEWTLLHARSTDEELTGSTRQAVGGGRSATADAVVVTSRTS